MCEDLFPFPTATSEQQHSDQRKACGCLSLQVTRMRQRGQVHLSLLHSWSLRKAVSAG